MIQWTKLPDLDTTVFFTNALFVFQDPIQDMMLHLVFIFLVSSSLWAFLGLFFHKFDSFEDCWLDIFVYYPSVWVWLIFFIINLVLRILWRNTTEVFLSHHSEVIAARFTLSDVNHDYLRKWLPGFSSVNLLFLSIVQSLEVSY